MKLLLDTCVWGGAAAELVQAGHDVLPAATWDEDPGDSEILARAQADARVLVTLDKDFGELVVVRGARHSGIVRVVNLSARQQGRAIASALAAHEADLRGGALITVEPGRIRIRPGAQ